MTIDSALRLPDNAGPLRPEANSFGVLPPEARPAPGRGPELFDQLTAAASALDELPGALGQLGDTQLTELMGLLLRMQARAGQVATVTASYAAEWGEIDRSDAANTTGWVRACAAAAGTSIEPRDAATIAHVAEASRDRRNHVIASAMAEGSCTLATARTALRQTEKVAAVLPMPARDEIHSWFLQLDPSTGTRGVIELTRRILAIYDPDGLSRKDAKLENVESLTWRTLPTGMLRLVADLSPANAAALKEAIGALSAPRPAAPLNDRGATTVGCRASGRGGAGRSDSLVPDERTPGKRRVDALLDLVAAGARAATGDGTPVGAAATALVMMDFSVLKDRLGAATTVTGEVLDASTARRLACDADIIPMVLGGPSQPLDVGRRERLVTKGMRAAVVVRDRGCTFPGCDRPPGFCEVHHLIPWWAGGATSLVNSAMLCRRHHQIVHRHGYFATVRDGQVSWDLTAGSMPDHRQSSAA